MCNSQTSFVWLQKQQTRVGYTLAQGVVSLEMCLVPVERVHYIFQCSSLNEAILSSANYYK